MRVSFSSCQALDVRGSKARWLSLKAWVPILFWIESLIGCRLNDVECFHGGVRVRYDLRMCCGRQATSGSRMYHGCLRYNGSNPSSVVARMMPRFPVVVVAGGLGSSVKGGSRDFDVARRQYGLRRRFGSFGCFG